jgi:hypothetical protein
MYVYNVTGGIAGSVAAGLYVWTYDIRMYVCIYVSMHVYVYNVPGGIAGSIAAGAQPQCPGPAATAAAAGVRVRVFSLFV